MPMALLEARDVHALEDEMNESEGGLKHELVPSLEAGRLWLR